MQYTPVAPNLDWDDVKLFLALCRSRSLGDAAKRLRVDGSTVSRRLTDLEHSLAATLFDRSRSGVSATEAAERLLPVAEEIEYAMARFAGAAESLEREVSGTVRLTCPSDVADVLVVPTLPELLRRYPALRIEILASEGLVDIARRQADLALRTVLPDTGDLVTKKLFDVRWTVAGAPSLIERVGRLRKWTDVPWLGWGERFENIPPARWLNAQLSEGVDIVLRSDSLDVQFSAAKAGLGVALLPEPSLDHYGLVSLPLSTKLTKNVTWPRDSLYMVTPRALRSVPRVRAVWETLSEVYADGPRRVSPR